MNEPREINERAKLVKSVEPEESVESVEPAEPEGFKFKREKPQIPEGMSKHQWKKMIKRKRWEENKGKMRVNRRKRKRDRNAERKRKIDELKEKGEDYSDLMPAKKPKKLMPEEQVSTGCRIIVDCGFDEMMLEREVVSLSNQITRSYSENKRSPYRVELLITSFNKRLKERYDKSIRDYDKWDETEVKFIEDDLDVVLKDEDLSKVVYLSADTEEKLEELKSGETYIVGGIVDKGRHKNLCKDKAEKLGIKTRRLPIDESIKISGRKVLATSHVVELLIKWFKYKDWKTAFEDVLPPRKLREEKNNEKVVKKKEAIEETLEDSD
ncbi:hypothetical protein FOA43_000778 [Brettanomyces nanus]|uniref:tRNA (guanine(9)-N1)-methyltransferase n=1 Tax=Eeniella nana TaxID=13502 RepID=A0A875RTG4_EENNA|nr:uncharacterized protein FOA43_000778 [Brettanomyces nanus]QPG73467.1 hypothetical protein FOA43_000778 [Brettanomyces nanus]